MDKLEEALEEMLKCHKHLISSQYDTYYKYIRLYKREFLSTVLIRSYSFRLKAKKL